MSSLFLKPNLQGPSAQSFVPQLYHLDTPSLSPDSPHLRIRVEITCTFLFLFLSLPTELVLPCLLIRMLAKSQHVDIFFITTYEENDSEKKVTYSHWRPETQSGSCCKLGIFPSISSCPAH